MIPRNEIEASLVNFVRAELVAETAEVTIDSSFDQLELDSFGILELVLHLERTVNRRIAPALLATLPTQTLRALVDLALSCTDAQNGEGA